MFSERPLCLIQVSAGQQCRARCKTLTLPPSVCAVTASRSSGSQGQRSGTATDVWLHPPASKCTGPLAGLHWFHRDGVSGGGLYRTWSRWVVGPGDSDAHSHSARCRHVGEATIQHFIGTGSCPVAHGPAHTARQGNTNRRTLWVHPRSLMRQCGSRKLGLILTNAIRGGLTSRRAITAIAPAPAIADTANSLRRQGRHIVVWRLQAGAMWSREGADLRRL